MCGIFGIGSVADQSPAASMEGHLDGVSRLLRFRPWQTSAPAPVGEAVRTMREARALSYECTRRAGFLALCGSSPISQELADVS